MDSETNNHEKFVAFYLFRGGTARPAIKELIVQALADLGLSMYDRRGQCYDSVGNMVSSLSQTSTRESNI